MASHQLFVSADDVAGMANKFNNDNIKDKVGNTLCVELFIEVVAQEVQRSSSNRRVSRLIQRPR